MTKVLKNVRTAVLKAGVPVLSRLLIPNAAVVFMLHRFRNPELGTPGHDPALVRKVLAYLRRRKYQLVSLEDLFDSLANGTPVRRCVAFTFDDGYREQGVVGAPLFAEFDCPSTTFVTTGFLDGKIWFWWDRIEYVFHKTRVQRIEVRLGDSLLIYQLSGEASRNAAQGDFTVRCKDVSDEEKHAAIGRLAAAAGVELPAKPAPEYVPMTWDELRRCEKLGMAFGPHTVSHPILSRTSDSQSAQELTEGWKRLRQEASRPVPIFCYPNGQLADFSAREIASLRQLGFKGAVVGVSGYAERNGFQRAPDSPFMVPRFAFDSWSDVLRLLAGLN